MWPSIYGIDIFQQSWPEDGIFHFNPSFPNGSNLKQKVDGFNYYIPQKVHKGSGKDQI
jgi:hypothetical protein